MLFSVGGVLICTALILALSIFRNERQLSPDVQLERILLVADDGHTAVVQLGFRNRRRGDVRGVTLNVLVPDYVEEIFRTDAAGNARATSGSMDTTPESLDGFYGSIYWQERGIDFPGRVAQPLYFAVVLRAGVREFPIRVRATSSDMPPLERRVTIDRGS